MTDVDREIEARFESALRQGRLAETSRVLVALSGGPDSSALLLLFAGLRRRWPGLHIVAGHVHHGIRGAEADADEALARRLAERLAVAFSITRFDTPAHAQARRISVESAGRELRLRAFREWCTAERLAAVATGHTADDQLTTVLGNIERGTGWNGLSGMPVVRALGGGSAAWLVRPLLGARRRELIELLARNGIEPCIDSTNSDTRIRRNRLRLETLPDLEARLGAGASDDLLSIARIARVRMDRVDEECEPLLATVRFGARIASVRRESLPSPHVDCELLAHLLRRIWQRLVETWDRTEHGGLARSHHLAWRSMLLGEPGPAGTSLPGGWRLARAGGWIHLLREEAAAPPEPRALGDDHVDLPWIGAVLHRSAVHAAGSRARGEFVPDAWLGADAQIRGWRPGDELATVQGHTPIGELLRAAGVPSELRLRYPVLVQAGLPRWVPGIRIAALSAEPRATSRSLMTARVDAAHSPAASLLDMLVSSGGRGT